MSEKLVSATPAGATPNPGRVEGYRWEAWRGADDQRGVSRGPRPGRQFLRESLRAVFVDNRLDAIVYPISNPAHQQARGGAEAEMHAACSVIFGPVLASLAGWPELDLCRPESPRRVLPVGISFMAPEHEEQQLLGFGYAFEQRSLALAAADNDTAVAGRTACLIRKPGYTNAISAEGSEQLAEQPIERAGQQNCHRQGEHPGHQQIADGGPLQA